MNPFFKKVAKSGLSDKNIKLSGGIFACISAILIYLSTIGTKVYIQSPIVATTVPRMLCVLMFIIGLSMIATWFLDKSKGKLKESEKDKVEKNSEPDINTLFLKITPFCSFVLLFLYVALMRPLGFIVASALYLTLQIPLLSVDLKPKTFLKSFIIGIVTGVLVYVIFSLGFGLRLPKNVFGF